jgi:hypothetical protein
MAGKTTFMRTLGVNLILMNAGGIVLANEFSSPNLDIYTSLRTVDTLQEGISTFYAEINKMKTIMAHPQGKALLEQMMAAMMPKEGAEVAGFKVSEGMLKMMMNFTIERMAKMAGKMFPQEALAQINAALQQIKK